MNWRRFLRRNDLDAEQGDELDFYIEATAEEYRARGMDPAEARAAARRKLGNVTQIREEVYGLNTLAWVEGALRDARYAIRTIRTRPGFSIPALLSLALGIGANVAIFSVVNAVLIRPLPYPEADRLVGVYHAAVFQGQATNDIPLSPDMFASYERTVETFQEFGVWTPGAATVTGVDEPQQVATVSMTEGVLPALGVRPLLGRWFSARDGARGTAQTVILSYPYWQSRFGGDPGVVGRIVLIDFVPHEVIGVMPRRFQFPNLEPEVLLPLRFAEGKLRKDEFNYSGLARLKPGIGLAQANQDIARALSIWGEGEGTRQLVEQLRFRPQVRPLKDDVVGDVGSVLKILMGALGLVLLLVSANVANLVLVRAEARRQEFAVRAALGAGEGRIARELLVESLTLGLVGGALGVGLAYCCLRLLITSRFAIPRASEISIDASSLLFAMACSAGAGLLFGAMALWQSGRDRSVGNARGSSPGARQVRAQNLLVVAQVGLALVLTIAAGLMVRSFVALRAVRPGFTGVGEIQTARIFLSEAQAPDPARVARMEAGIVSRMAAIPGVTAAGFASGLPLEPEYHNGNAIAVEGKTPPGQIPPNRTTKRISPGLLAAMGTRLLAGRDFTWNEEIEARNVAIVSDKMARDNWGDARTALGKRIRMGGDGPWIDVIGVAEDVREDGVDRPAPEIVYLTGGRRGVTLALRSSRTGTESLAREMAAAAHAVDAGLALAKVRSFDEVYRRSTARTSFALVLLGIAGGMALTLATVGVYGVLAYAVAGRRREVSIRIALGAEPGTVASLFLRKGLLLASAGGALGLVAAGILSRWIASLLFGVTPLDGVTYVSAGAAVMLAAAAASYIPARRAAAVDPMETLRGE